jgi:long-subunit fatty acid transport protein
MLVSLGLFADPARAQEVVLDSYAGIGARARAMGGAYSALSSDFTGLFWNPAGLARASSGEFYTSFSHESFRNQSRFYGSPSTNRLSSSRLNAIGIVAPYPVLQGSLTFGGGYGKTQSLNSGLCIDGYDTAADFEKSGVSEDRGSMGAYVAGGAVDLAPGTSVGVSLQVWRGSNRFEQELTQTDTRDAHGDTVRLYQSLALSDDYKGIRLRAGFLYHHPSGLRFGLMVASPMTMNVSSTFEDSYEDVFEDGTDTYPVERISDTYSIRYPFEFGAAAAWERGRFTLAGDAAYADLQGATYSELPASIAPQVDDFRVEYRSAFRLHLGGEYRLLDDRLALRAGYYRDPVSYKGGGSRPQVRVENDRDVFTFGLGGLLEQTVALDVGMTVGGYRQIEGSREDHVRSVRIFASTGYKF